MTERLRETGLPRAPAKPDHDRQNARLLCAECHAIMPVYWLGDVCPWCREDRARADGAVK